MSSFRLTIISAEAGSSIVSKPTYVNTNVAFDCTFDRVKLPSKSDTAPELVFLTIILTPIKGRPSALDFTVPLTEMFWAVAVVAKAKQTSKV